MRRVYESVVRTSPRPNNFIRGAQRWHCAVGDARMEIEGYLYAQQNDVTNCCAHVAIRTAAARFHRNGDMTYREMNRILGVDHRARVVGHGQGLEAAEIAKVLEAAGATCVAADFTLPPASQAGVGFQKYLYGSCESGYPAILCFRTSGGSAHAVPVFGHTFNEDMWVASAEGPYFRLGPETQYVPSEHWLSSFIAHDDNFGSNYCIPRHYLRVLRHGGAHGTPPQPAAVEGECVSFVVGTLPGDVALNAIQAEAIGADYLLTILPQVPGRRPVWERRLEMYRGAGQLVLRAVLTRMDAYADHLRRVRDWEGRRVDAAFVGLLEGFGGDRVWVVEMSVPELFQANRRKIGEAVLWASRKAGTTRDMTSFLVARLPGYVVLYESGGAGRPRYVFLPCRIAATWSYTAVRKLCE